MHPDIASVIWSAKLEHPKWEPTDEYIEDLERMLRGEITADEIVVKLITEFSA